jgi:hypothetical protein
MSVRAAMELTRNHDRATPRAIRPDDPRLPKMRRTIFWWAPFDRPIVLTALTGASAMLAVWATPIPVRVIGPSSP